MAFASNFGRILSPTFQPHSLKKGGGWWDLNGTITSCIAAYQPKGAASYAASKVNLTGNTDYDATEVVGTVSWDNTNGWIGDETNYLDTSIIPAGLGWTLVVRATNLYYSKINAIAGIYASSEVGRLQLICLTTGLSFGYGDKRYTDTSKPTSGVFGVTYSDAYYNGSSIGSIGATTLINNDNLSIYLLTRDHINAHHYPTSAKIQAAAIYNATLTSTQIGNLTTAMAAL